MKYSKDDLAFLKFRHALQRRSDEPMTGKVCVISGATSGVGLEAAKRLAQGGAELVLVSRNAQKAQAVQAMLRETYGVKVHLVSADFARLEDVRKAAALICARWDRLDVLINSAGLHCTRRQVTADGNELVFQVNHLAPFLLTALLLGPLGRARQARVIQVNSEGHRFGGLNLQDLDWKRRPYIGLRAYGASKIAQIAAVKELAGRLNSTGITVNAMHPGGVRTGIGSNNGPLYRAWMRLVIRHFLKDPAISGDALYYLSAAPELAGTSGEYFHLTLEAKPLQRVMDQQLRAAVWEKTLPLCGLSPEFLQDAVGSQLAGEDGNGQA